MTKRIMTMFLLLVVAVGLYFMQGKADGVKAQPTNTASSVPTVTPWVCAIQTGINGGTVNLRTCAGTSCGVVKVLTEGERLTIRKAGAWMNVTTEDGVTGWLNSKYCKGK